MRAIRELNDGPVQRALSELNDGPAQQALRALHDSPVQKALANLYDSPTLKAIRDLEDSPILRAAKELEDREQAIRRIAGHDLAYLRNEAAHSVSSDWLASTPPNNGSAPLQAPWSGPRKSDELRHLSEEAGRAKAEIDRQIEKIDPVEGDDARQELEVIRSALAVQQREGRNAARLERRKERKAEADYWFRQWMNSLAIGNGAAFLAVTSGLLQASRFELAVVLVFAPLTYFALGLLFAGSP